MFFTLFLAVSNVFRKKRRLQDDLTRLAETSSHLLCDMGFEEDRKAQIPGYRRFRKDQITITLCDESETAIVTIDEARNPGRFTR